MNKYEQYQTTKATQIEQATLSTSVCSDCVTRLLLGRNPDDLSGLHAWGLEQESLGRHSFTIDPISIRSERGYPSCGHRR